MNERKGYKLTSKLPEMKQKNATPQPCIR